MRDLFHWGTRVDRVIEIARDEFKVIPYFYGICVGGLMIGVFRGRSF